MSFLSVFLFYGCICILELEVIMVYLKVSFDLYVPRVFSVMRLYLMPADLWLHSLVYQQGLTRESVWVGIPHWAPCGISQVFLRNLKMSKSQQVVSLGPCKFPREGPLLFYLCAVNFIVRVCHSQEGSEILFNLATLNLVLFVIQG